jgi:uracil-DNA glycosylase family 4
MLIKPFSLCNGCPLYSGPWGKTTGFSVPDGAMKGGVIIVAEALGQDEEREGKPLVGASGYTLFQQLARIGIERDDFRILNVLSCRPPDNKLVKMPYEADAIRSCSPYLDRNITNARQEATEAGKTPVIVTLGNTAFKRVMGYDDKKHKDLLAADFYAYPHRSDRYNAWVLNAPHPAYLLRGNTHLWPVIHFVFKRALEIAAGGLVLDECLDYELDPTPEGFELWAQGYVRSLEVDPDNPLSYDIETPYKKKTKNEDDLVKEDEYNDHTILRISFSYWCPFLNRTVTTSIKWSSEYLAIIEFLFGIAKFVLGWNSDKYDYPRVSKHVKVKGIGLDGMVAWHILNTALPKSLGFVTPYYWQTTGMWKHLSNAQPAFYNAKDADAALRNWRGIKRHLEEANLWHVYERHWIKLYGALKFMTGIGVLQDAEARDAAEAQLTTILDGIEAKMEDAVPLAARKFKLAKKKPKDLSGWSPIEKVFPVKRCSGCGKSRPGKAHFKSKPRRDCERCLSRWSNNHIALRKAKHNPCVGAVFIERETNPCVIATAVDSDQVVQCWTRPLEFKLSKLGLTNYQQVLKHKAILSRKEKKVTFDEDAIVLLMRKYPNDPLYPLIIDYRKAGKLLGTYVGVKLPSGRLSGGMPVGSDGRIHTSFGRNASTLRFTSEDPNLQNLPRPSKNKDDIANLIRNLIVAGAGNILYARDFSGIEAVLVGYFAADPGYIRLSKRDVHTFYTVYAIHALEGPKRILASELPQLDWPDEKLFEALAELKGRFSHERNSLYKHLVHAANFMQGAKGARDKIFSETRIEYPVETVAKVMDVYYNLFPKIRAWHSTVLDEAEKDGYLRNPFGYVHRFARPYEYKNVAGQWEKKPGPDANKVIAFKAQSTAVGIITEAILRLFYNRFEEAGTYMRLQIHDELFFECPESYMHTLDKVVKEEMERPVPELRMPESWNLGSNLAILTEEKYGKRWGQMKG